MNRKYFRQGIVRGTHLAVFASLLVLGIVFVVLTNTILARGVRTTDILAPDGDYT